MKLWAAQHSLVSSTFSIIIQVVEQIDRLTASIDLNEKAPCITQGSTSNDRTHAGDFRVAPLLSHKPAPAQAPRQAGEDRLILRTNSVSPVHMASVVKTSRFTPPSLQKDVNHKKPSVNGHPPQMHHAGMSNHTDQIHPEHHPQTLDPKVIIGNSTSDPRTQKPPPYPQNGRCGKGQNPSSKPVRTPACPVRGRHSTSMVWRRRVGWGGGVSPNETQGPAAEREELREGPGRGTTHCKLFFTLASPLLQCWCFCRCLQPMTFALFTGRAGFKVCKWIAVFLSVMEKKKDVWCVCVCVWAAGESVTCLLLLISHDFPICTL